MVGVEPRAMPVMTGQTQNSKSLKMPIWISFVPSAASPAKERLTLLWVTAVIVSVGIRSEEHTSELQSLMRISYAVFCLKKKKTQRNTQQDIQKHISHQQTI